MADPTPVVAGTDELILNKLEKNATRDKKVLSGFTFAFADRLDYLNPAHWDLAAAHGSVFLSRDYLGALDAGGVKGATMRYGLIYRDAKPVACFATQTVDITGDRLVPDTDELTKEDKTQLALKKLNRKALEKVRRKLTVCGNLVSWGMDGFAYDPEEHAPDMWQGLTEALYRIRRADKLYGATDYLMVKDLPESVREEGSAMATHSYRALKTEPNMVLVIEPGWNCFEDYLTSLTAKYRKAARNVYKSLEKEEVSLVSLQNPHERAADLHTTYKAVASRAGVRLAELAESFLPDLQMRLGPERFVTLALESKDGKFLGFVTVLRDRDTAVGYYMGLEYDSNESLPIYHRLLFAVIEQALEWKCARISFGRTALDAKARLGCKPEPTFVWVRHRIPLVNLFVRQLVKVVPHDVPPDRNPFKD